MNEQRPLPACEHVAGFGPDGQFHVGIVWPHGEPHPGSEPWIEAIRLAMGHPQRVDNPDGTITLTWLGTLVDTP